MPLTTKDLDRLEKMMRAKGVWNTEWKVRADRDSEEFEVHGGVFDGFINCVAQEVANENTAKLIAAMKNALPDLIAAARAQLSA